MAGFIVKANPLPATEMGGAVRLDCGTTRDLSPPAAFRGGAEPAPACRPIRMRLDSGPGPNRLPARVAFARDIPQAQEIHAEADGRTRACEPPFPAPVRPGPGETLHLEFPPGMLRAVPARKRAEAA